MNLNNRSMWDRNTLTWWIFVTFLLVLNVYSGFAHGPQNIQLTDDNWDQILDGEWMVEFFAPWCPACRNLQPVWDDFSSWSNDLGIQIGQVDITNSPGLSGRFMITALPTIYHIKDGVFRQYRGSRTKDDFLMFIEEKKWNEIAPISSWQAPSSFQMTVISQFYRLSMSLRNFMNMMTSEYGLPPWGTYVIFGVGTICLGLFFGLLLVCIIDFVYPPKKPQKSAFGSTDTSNVDSSSPAHVEQEDDEDFEELDDDDLGKHENDDEDTSSQAEEEGDKSAPGSPTENKDNLRRRPKKID